ncbi:MAG: HD domain-containing phosphohydrolase [Candidatus Omnitrophota bacterium]|nr:HD domain-containing protein [Candidatus Omnitrophota bacterium]MBU1929314.1 HD domain-containing protein [Candidatus Omnitrophota bacterium]MBU2035606.1 HD domain-containing protein [Candidatus Omnitrophota bacterium]MBU2221602.1 HD domain-containing protein [Candidatus Omnitrophota bacterium]MBU2258537.1 HD domain-containing protein [Candidatus Omnitrophota bacterium]
MKRVGFQLKLSLVFISALTIILIATTYFVYQKAVIQQKENLRQRIIDLAKLSSLLIDGDKLVQIKPEMESQDTLAYKEIRSILQKIKIVDPLIDDVYTMIKSNKENVLLFLVDAGDKNNIIAYCGERYDVTNMPRMKEAFIRPAADDDLIADKWGIWLSGYAPVRNQNGEVVAIVGLDVSAASIRQMQLSLARSILGVLILAIIVSFLLGWLVGRGITSPLRLLIKGTKEVEKGNFNYKVKVKSGDELEELGSAFNKMNDGLKNAQNKLQQHYLDTIKSLARVLDAKDGYTKGHSERVAFYAVNIARHLKLPPRELKLLEDICILHDIGKIGIPEKILYKSEPLTDEEWRVIKMHPKIGEEILENIETLRPGLTIVRDHHERPDGKGYPRGLRLDEVSLLASIVIVSDAYDAMTSDRPYRKAFTKNQAIAVLKENKSTQFDPRIVEAFIDYLQEDA